MYTEQQGRAGGLRREGALLVLLAAQLGLGVGDGDVELAGALHDRLALERRHVVRDLGAVFPVVHQQQLQVLDVADDELVEAVGQDVAGALVGAVADVGHVNARALELAAHARVDTLGAAP